MQLFNNPAKNRPMVNTINGRSRLDLVPRKVRLEATTSYNVLGRRRTLVWTGENFVASCPSSNSEE